MTTREEDAIAWRAVHQDSGDSLTWGIAVEAPVELRINAEPWTVMLATPADLEELAVGLALTEQVVDAVEAIGRVEVHGGLGEYVVTLHIDAPLTSRRTRTIAGNSGCGLCGLESLSALRALRPPAATSRPTVSDTAIHAAFAALPAHQAINAATHSVHAAGWCDPVGRPLLVREDVGRHNALDKLIGALAMAGRLDEAGFLVMSSRCSYELVAKAARSGASLLATVSAPTTMALDWASALALPIACRGPRDTVVRFPCEVSHDLG
jgi:FdhD protein